MHADDEAEQSRVGRSRARRSRRLRIVAIAVALVALVAVIVVGGFAVERGVDWASLLRSHAASAGPPLAASTLMRPASQESTAGHIEVPELSGMPLAQAQTVLQAAGLVAHVSVSPTLAPSAEQDVAGQTPIAGTVVLAGAAVSLSVPPAGKGSAAVSSPRRKGPYVVAIDPGHQSHADTALEPVGPGSPVTQPKVTAGSTGVATGIPEYEIDLQIATNLENRLQVAGVRVVMTRTTNDVDISNAQRAQVANVAKADLFVRVHADSKVDPAATGVSTLYPASNQWTKPIAAASQKAAEAVQGAVVASTGAADNGAVARTDVTGFNWARVPSILVDSGNPANAVEDRLLTSARYQDVLAQGMADGILKYLGMRR